MKEPRRDVARGQIGGQFQIHSAASGAGKAQNSRSFERTTKTVERGIQNRIADRTWNWRGTFTVCVAVTIITGFLVRPSLSSRNDTKKGGASVPMAQSATERYSEALRMMREENYAKAASAFLSFLTDYPINSGAPRAAYNAAACFQNLADKEPGIVSLEKAEYWFTIFVQTYPRHEWVPKANDNLSKVKNLLHERLALTLISPGEKPVNPNLKDSAEARISTTVLRANAPASRLVPFNAFAKLQEQNIDPAQTALEIWIYPPRGSVPLNDMNIYDDSIADRQASPLPLDGSWEEIDLLALGKARAQISEIRYADTRHLKISSVSLKLEAM